MNDFAYMFVGFCILSLGSVYLDKSKSRFPFFPFYLFIVFTECCKRWIYWGCGVVLLQKRYFTTTKMVFHYYKKGSSCYIFGNTYYISLLCSNILYATTIFL